MPDEEPPELRGQRVLLRAPRPADVNDRLAAGRDPEFRRMVGAPASRAGPLTAADAARWYARLAAEPLGWIIEHDGRCIGEARLHRFDEDRVRASFAIGLFRPEDRGHGLGAEATRLVLDHAFGPLALEEVRVRVLAFNTRAIATYSRAGFRETHREWTKVDGEGVEDIHMAVSAADHAKLRAADTGPA